MNSIGAVSSDTFSLQVLFLFVPLAVAFAFLVGVTLASRNARAIHAMNSLNHWISLRRGLKVFMVPHDVTASFLGRPLLLGAVVLLGAATSVYVLATFDSEAFREMLFPAGAGAYATALAAFVRWTLLAGNAACVVVGLVMIGAPALWLRLERRADRWYSLRKATLPLDRMHTEFDGWVLAHPTVSGIALIVVSLGLAVATYARWPW
jgi:hypothetical protein